MMDEPELKELLKNLNEEYDEVTIEIHEKCTTKEDCTDEFITQNKIRAQIGLVQHILESKGKASLAEKAELN